MEGFCKDEVCNRNGCVGIIEEHEKEGSCSCHINPPCSYCTEPSAFCPACNWSASEEQEEYDKKQTEYWAKYHKETYTEQNRAFEEKRKLFYEKFNGKIEATELEMRTETHTHFSMKVVGVHPKGFDLNPHMDKIRGTFGGRFSRKNNHSFEYIAYTD